MKKIKAPYNSIVNLTKQLVKVPSKGGIDNMMPIVEVTEKWISKNLGIKPDIIKDENGDPIAILLDFIHDKHARTYCFDACLDTAPIGDESEWSFDPYGRDVESKANLFGRGAADSKIAVSIFLHLVPKVQDLLDKKQLKVNFLFLFDLDEHTGKFSGIKYVVKKYNNILSGVYIGYPGHENIKVGSRGFARFKIETNSIKSANRIIDIISSSIPYEPPIKYFDKRPKFNVTFISGGFRRPNLTGLKKTDKLILLSKIDTGDNNYTIIPPNCNVFLDVSKSLNTEFKGLLNKLVNEIDYSIKAVRKTEVNIFSEVSSLPNLEFMKRYVISLKGKSSHSGGSEENWWHNAIYGLPILIEKLEDISKKYGFKICYNNSVTLIGIDYRLTPDYKKSDAEKDLKDKLLGISDLEFKIHNVEESWPAYRIDDNSHLLVELKNAHKKVFNNIIESKVSGPSNIGNYLAQFNIPTISGYGVSFENIHAANERVYTNSISPIFKVYSILIDRLNQIQEDLFISSSNASRYIYH